MHADQQCVKTLGEVPRNLQARLEPAVIGKIDQDGTVGHGSDPSASCSEHEFQSSTMERIALDQSGSKDRGAVSIQATRRSGTPGSRHSRGDRFPSAESTYGLRYQRVDGKLRRIMVIEPPRGSTVSPHQEEVGEAPILGSAPLPEREVLLRAI